MKKTILPLICCSLFSIACQKLPVKSAETEKTQITSPKEIKRCVCVQMWMPVCGKKDKKTYSNACFADCAGVEYTMGSCDQIE